MKKRAVVQTLDQVGAPVSALQQLASFTVQLNLPTIVRSYFEHSLGRPYIQSGNILPCLDLGLRHCRRHFQNLLKTHQHLLR